MSQMVFINLPVSDLARSVDFFTTLGYEFNPQFTDESATCMIVSEHIYVMLLQHDRFRTFIDRAVADTHQSVAVLTAFNFDSAAAVKDICERAFAAGGRRYKEPEDLGFMYSWGFEDPDGNIFEAFWMDPTHVQ